MKNKTYEDLFETSDKSRKAKETDNELKCFLLGCITGVIWAFIVWLLWGLAK